MPLPLRELPGRELIQEIQRFEWRYKTLQDDYRRLMKIRSPPLQSTRQQRFTNRDNLYEAERRLHNYLSGYYSFFCLVTTVAEIATESECTGRIKYQRKQFEKLPSSRIVLGLRHYVQHENILPLVIWQSHHSDNSPAYALSKQELHMGQGYNNGFEYHYGTIDGPVLFPFKIIKQNWPAVEVLRQRTRNLLREFQSDELLEYKERLEEMQNVWDEMTEEYEIHPIAKQMIESDQSIPSELRILVEGATEEPID